MIEVLQKSADAVLSLFLMGLVGYILTRRNWFGPESKTMIPRLVTIIALPPYLFANMLNTFNRDELSSLIYGSLVPAISILVIFLVALAAVRLLKVPQGRKGLFIVGCTSSNTMFIGLPVNITLFGPEALQYVLLYFISNTVFFWTVGNYCMSLDGQRDPEPLFSLSTLKRVFSPPLMGFGLGLLLVIIELRPPVFIMNAATYIGSLTTPLATIFIGVTLASVSLKSLHIDRDVLFVLFGRFILSPLMIITLISFVELPPLMAKVFIIQSSLPIVSSAVLLASYHKSDTAFASVTVSLTTLMAMGTIPLFMVIISFMNY